MAQFDVRAMDRTVLARRMAGAAQARWFVLNCEPDCREHNKLAYRQRIEAVRWWRSHVRAFLGGR